MLSRVAGGLFWMSRYVERAETVARLLDAGRRINAIPSSPEVRAAEWASIIVASGCRETFPKPLEEADQRSVAQHLIFDESNPSSIRMCLYQARTNARAMRTAVTADAWEAINESWIAMRAKAPEHITGGEFAPFLDWAKGQAQKFRGAIDDTLLRDSGYNFTRLGQYVERADATARLLDVKYHVLLPADAEVGGVVDEGQWVQILRAAGALRAYRHVYRASVTPDRVVHYLVLNGMCPRSLRYCSAMVLRQLDELRTRLGQSHAAHTRAGEMFARLQDLEIAEVFTDGLHEFLTGRIEENNRLAVDIAAGYGFGPAEAALQEQLQED
ncbi:MAG: alpha-E domain-containing protein [Pseudomonadota bacterium]